MSTDELLEIDTYSHAKELRQSYMKQLRYDDDVINFSEDILETIRTVLDRFDVRQQTLEWHREGVKLVDGKVVLPDGMEEVIDELVKENLLYSYYLPEKFGGLGKNGFMIGPLTEAIAEYDFPLQMNIMLGFTVIEALLLYYKEPFDDIIQDFAEGKRKSGYVGFTEPNAGSNLAAIRSTSEKVGDEWVLNGTKIFQTNGGYAETGLFLARNMVDGKAQGTNVFVVPSLDNIEVLRLEEKSGIHASPTAQLRFENVTVPEEFLIAKQGVGYEKVLERLLGMRVGVAFQGVAASRRAFEIARQYAQDREQFGKPIIQFDRVRQKLETIQQQLPRIETYAYRAAFGLDRYMRGWIPVDIGANAKPSAEEQAASNFPSQVRVGLMHYLASSAKAYTSEITNYLLYDAQQIFGGSGFVAETEINKIVGDSRVLSIYDGTTEIQEFILEQSMPALRVLPKFKRTYEQFEDSTMYERFLFEKYPDLDKKL